MGVISVTEEFTSPVFKALIINSDNLLPKIMPQIIKNIELIEGDGGVGSIKQINFADSKALQKNKVKNKSWLVFNLSINGNSPPCADTGFKAMKNRIEYMNEESCEYNYTLIEGDALAAGKVEKIYYGAKFEASANGGTISKMTGNYYTVCDAVISEEEVYAGKGKAVGMYKVVEAYLLQNPDAHV